MKRFVVLALVLATCVALLGLTGCYRKELPESQQIHIGSVAATGTLVTDSPSISLGGAEELDVTLRMGAGELALESGGTDALVADFEYRPASLKPEVSYDVIGSAPPVGRLTVEQPDFEPSLFRDAKNSWSLQLAKDVPLDLSVDLGAGESDLSFTGLGLRDLTMNMGAGDSTLDFSGAWDHSVTADIKAGVGQITLKLPADVGVRVEGRRAGIGDFVADDGFVADGDTFVNRAYGDTASTIQISVQRGIGEVRLETVQ